MDRSKMPREKEILSLGDPQRRRVMFLAFVRYFAFGAIDV